MHVHFITLEKETQIYIREFLFTFLLYPGNFKLNLNKDEKSSFEYLTCIWNGASSHYKYVKPKQNHIYFS